MSVLLGKLEKEEKSYLTLNVVFCTQPQTTPTSFDGYDTSTLQAHVSEAYYQKMEVYFCEIIAAARKQVPLIFSTKTTHG
jgi:hypothetical protein